MNFIEFNIRLKDYLVFSIGEIEKQIPGFNKMNLMHWQKKNYIKKLRNSFYCFADIDYTMNDLFLIANKIYAPSYISLESALYYYGIIPEAVFLIRSVSTMKTKQFKNSLASFQYNHLKQDAFFGYSLIQHKGQSFKVAEIEKALPDLLYLRSNLRSVEDLEALRLNKSILKETINFKKLDHYAKIYNSKLLIYKTDQLKRYIDA